MVAYIIAHFHILNFPVSAGDFGKKVLPELVKHLIYLGGGVRSVFEGIYWIQPDVWNKNGWAVLWFDVLSRTFVTVSTGPDLVIK